MKIYAAGDGSIVSCAPGEYDRLEPVLVYAATFWFDEDTNPDLAQDIQAFQHTYSLVAGVLLHNGLPVTINPPSEQHQAEGEAKTGYGVLPDWAKIGTAAQAETKISNDFSLPAVGTLENAKTFINDNLVDIPTSVTTVAQLRTAINIKLATIRAVFNAMIDLFIVIRNYYIIIAKLLIYIRDLVIRFRGG